MTTTLKSQDHEMWMIIFIKVLTFKETIFTVGFFGYIKLLTSFKLFTIPTDGLPPFLVFVIPIIVAGFLIWQRFEMALSAKLDNKIKKEELKQAQLNTSYLRKKNGGLTDDEVKKLAKHISQQINCSKSELYKIIKDLNTYSSMTVANIIEESIDNTPPTMEIRKVIQQWKMDNEIF